MAAGRQVPAVDRRRVAGIRRAPHPAEALASSGPRTGLAINAGRIRNDLQRLQVPVARVLEGVIDSHRYEDQAARLENP